MNTLIVYNSFITVITMLIVASIFCSAASAFGFAMRRRAIASQAENNNLRMEIDQCRRQLASVEASLRDCESRSVAYDQLAEEIARTI
jgi:hypothetical protein